MLRAKREAGRSDERDFLYSKSRQRRSDPFLVSVPIRMSGWPSSAGDRSYEAATSLRVGRDWACTTGRGEESETEERRTKKRKWKL
jgi:hypothetical protein